MNARLLVAGLLAVSALSVAHAGERDSFPSPYWAAGIDKYAQGTEPAQATPASVQQTQGHVSQQGCVVVFPLEPRVGNDGPVLPVCGESSHG